MPFMFSEMRRTAQLLCEGKSGDQIVSLSMQENIYQLEREKRRRDVPLRMLNRLSTLNESLVAVVAKGNEKDAKLISFLALIKVDRLFYEYIREVYLDHFLAGKNEVADKDFIDFIERKADDSDVVAKWTSNNFVRIRNTYKSILCEAGLGKRSSDGLLIQKPLADRDLLNMLGDDDAPYARAMLMEG
jgi:hypothetical protein